jgi:hypothetical protein
MRPESWQARPRVWLYFWTNPPPEIDGLPAPVSCTNPPVAGDGLAEPAVAGSDPAQPAMPAAESGAPAEPVMAELNGVPASPVTPGVAASREALRFPPARAAAGTPESIGPAVLEVPAGVLALDEEPVFPAPPRSWIIVRICWASCCTSASSGESMPERRGAGIMPFEV